MTDGRTNKVCIHIGHFAPESSSVAFLAFVVAEDAECNLLQDVGLATPASQGTPTWEQINQYKIIMIWIKLVSYYIVI